MNPSVPIEGESSPVEPTLNDQSAAPRKRNVAFIWGVVACLLLGTSAVVRGVQHRRHQEEANWIDSCPFLLEQIPKTLGHWTVSAEDQTLDSRTLLITGGKEHIIRTYSDGATGVRLIVLILFGPIEPVIPHIPEVCYPANGFKKLEEPIDRTINYSMTEGSGKETAERSATFRSAVYQKLRLLEGAYYSFRYNGEWSPEVNGGRKLPRRNPGIFKLQIQRVMAPGESRDIDKYPDPIEDFLKSLLPAIENRIGQSAAKDASKAVAAK
jgi:Protein of unknown function (DUF3485)